MKLTPQTKKILIYGGVGAAALLAVVLVAHSRQRPSTQADVQSTVQRALVSETDPKILRQLAAALFQAGQEDVAAVVTARADILSKPGMTQAEFQSAMAAAVAQALGM